jgi:D-alanine-D-alanine ligase
MLHIGFVYDLRTDYLKMGMSEEETAEFDSEETIFAIEQALINLGHQVERIGNLHHLVESLAAGKRFDLVFNIAEGIYGISRESQVPALLEGYQIPFSFSSPDVLAICHNKALAKQQVRNFDLATAPFRLIRSISELDCISLPFPLFMKPVAEGAGKGITNESLILNQNSLRQYANQLLRDFKQPVLIETFLPGREFTVGLLGQGDKTEVLGTLEVLLKNNAEPVGHTYHNKEHCEDLVSYKLVTDKVSQNAAQLAKDCWKVLGCRDAGRIDIRCDLNGKPYFLEVNPLAGLHPTHSDLPILASQLGITHAQLIGSILKQSIARYPHLQEKLCACSSTL